MSMLWIGHMVVHELIDRWLGPKTTIKLASLYRKELGYTTYVTYESS